jgi:membrane protease YdiL (CAAX protease family)
MQEAKKGISKVILFYFLGAIVLYTVIILCQAIAAFVIPQMRTDTNVQLAVSLISQYAIGFPLMILLITRVPGRAPEKSSIRVGTFLLFLIIAYAGMVLSNYIGTGIGLIIDSLMPGATASTNAVQMLLMDNNWVVVIFAVVGAPIMEELIFRKLLVDRMLVYGEGTACVVSGLIFGLFHGNLTQFVYAFVLGVVFAYVYCKYGDVRITMLMHMIINFMGSVVAIWILSKSGYMEFAEALQESANDPEAMMQIMTEHAAGLALMGFYFLFIVALVITGVVLFFVFKRRIVLKPGEIVIPKGQRFSTVILNLGMILFILLSLGLILYSMFANVLMELVMQA